MHFGRLPEEEIPLIDYTLAPDAPLTASVLSASKPGNLQVSIGGTKWGSKEWVGQIYPFKTKDADFLDEYVKHFNAIELNATFYNVPTQETVGKWKDKADTSSGFKFCPKFPQSITHIRRLKNAEAITTSFYEVIGTLDDKLGPLLLQLSDNFRPKSYPELEAYLTHLPKGIPVFVELRHKEWFANTDARENVFSLLHELNIGSVITDAAGRRDCVHMALTTPNTFIRFVGNGDNSDKKRLDDWVTRIEKWSKEGLQNVWFFIHQQNDKQTPETVYYLCEQLNRKLGLNLPYPHFLNR